MSALRCLLVATALVLLLGCSDGGSPSADAPARSPLPPEPVVFTELPPDSLHFGLWNLVAAGIDGDVLELEVGFSGCGPEQPWTFYISGGFMESWPIQVRGVLVHEADEDCDAAWTAELAFDLLPLRAAYLEAYGEGEILILDLVDFEGVSHPLEYRIDVATGIPER